MVTDRRSTSRGIAHGQKAQSLSALGAEAEQVVASDLFRKSAVLTKLLIYLCQETLADRDTSLKSYTVAVDGLGRSPDFDAQSDSYPRVQVARLRKLLETFYAGPGSSHDPCLQIPNGSYTVKLFPRLEAYPGLAPAAELKDHSDKAGLGTWPRPAGTASFSIKRSSVYRLVLAAFVGFAIAGMAYLFLRPAPLARAAPASSAIVNIGPMSHDGDPQSASIAQNATAILLNGLSRSWPLRVQTPLDKVQADDSGHVYRLETQLGASQQGGRTIYGRLFDHASGTLVWSQEFQLSRNDSQLDDALDSMVARVGGTFGVVATSEVRRLRNVFTPGYACALQYFRYTTAHDPAMPPKLDWCIRQPTTESRLEGTIMGIRAMSSLDFPATTDQRTAMVSAARNLADQIVATYPNDHIANFALARLAFARNDCQVGTRHGKLTLAQNDNDPITLGVVSILLSYCEVQRAEALVDRAFRFQVEGDTSARMTTIFTAIASNRRDRLEILSSLPVQEDAENSAYNHFCNTMLFAALDRREEAQASWAKYQTALRLPAGQSTDDLIAVFVPSELSQEKVGNFLRSKGVVS